jgi:prevent-host-death family protein
MAKPPISPRGTTDAENVERVSSAQLRPRLTEIVGRAQYRKQPTIITNYRRDVAAIVPIEMIERSLISPEQKKTVSAARPAAERKRHEGRNSG